MEISQTPLYSPAGWYARATPLPKGSPCTITQESLAFIVSTNSESIPYGLIVAFLKPNTAIDSQGRILTVQEKDWNALVQLADATTSLPRPEGNNTWRFEEIDTCSSIETIYIATPDGIHTTTISAWGHKYSELERPFGDIVHLPEELQLLLNYSFEAFEGSHPVSGDPAVEVEAMRLVDPEYM